MKNINTILFFIVVSGFFALALDAAAQSEIQQQLESVSSTIDSAGAQLESVKEKGILQTVWDNITAPFASIWQQITGIFSQLTSMFLTVAK